MCPRRPATGRRWPDCSESDKRHHRVSVGRLPASWPTPIRIVDVTDEAGFGAIPPCADPGFDHRSCDYWEDDARGSKAARLSLAGRPPAPTPDRRRAAGQPVPRRPRSDRAAAATRSPRPPVGQPVPRTRTTTAARRTRSRRRHRRQPSGRSRCAAQAPAPRSRPRRRRAATPRSSSWTTSPSAYAQFGPLTAYPRAQRTRDLYPALPDAPLPAVITCIATTAEARGGGLGRDAGRRGLRRPRRAAGSPRSRPTPRPARDRTRRAPRPRRSGVGAGSRSRSTTQRFPVMRRELV